MRLLPLQIGSSLYLEHPSPLAYSSFNFHPKSYFLKKAFSDPLNRLGPLALGSLSNCTLHLHHNAQNLVFVDLSHNFAVLTYEGTAVVYLVHAGVSSAKWPAVDFLGKIC